MNASYLMIGCEGSKGIFVTDESPTADDIESAQVGTLHIIRLADLHYLDVSGKWAAIEEGVATTVEMEGEHHGPFHVPRSML